MKNTSQKHQLHKLKNMCNTFSQGHLFSVNRASIIIHQQLESAIKETERIVGKEKTKELFEQFMNEAFAKPNTVNHQYIIKKLYDFRESAKNAL